MIAKECRDWIDAVHDCFPRLKTAGLDELLSGLAPSFDGGRWEIGIDSLDVCSRPEFRLMGAGLDMDSLSSRASKRLGLRGKPRRAAPPAGFPWLSFLWDMKSGTPQDACLFGAGSEPDQSVGTESGERTVVHVAKPFSSDLLEDPSLAAVLKDFAALCPINRIVTEWELDSGRRRPRERWRLTLATPEPWTRFCRLNIATPFQSEYSQLAYLNLDRGVTELSFEGARLRAYFGA